jgi:hypothetical protein
MKCQQGDVARIIYSVRPENIGRIVKVVDYIGKYNAKEEWEFRGMPCQAPVHDHYWWIEADDLSSGFGPSPRAYIADTWLEPIRPEQEKQKSKADQELDIFL